MKKTMTTMALIAVLGTMATGCQKETTNDAMWCATESSEARKVNYTVDGEAHQIELSSEADWDAFVAYTMELAKKGHSVSMADEGANSIAYAVKEAIVFRTPNQDEAEAWTKRMVDEGYRVDVAFDKEKGDFICVATKK